MDLEIDITGALRESKVSRAVGGRSQRAEGRAADGRWRREACWWRRGGRAISAGEAKSQRGRGLTRFLLNLGLSREVSSATAFPRALNLATASKYH